MKKPTRQASLSGGNLKALDMSIGVKGGLDNYIPLLRLLAEMLDNIAEGEDVYISIGSTKRKDAFLLTLTWDKEQTFLPAASFEDMAAGSSSFL